MEKIRIWDKHPESATLQIRQKWSPVAAAADGLDEVDKVVRGEGQLQRAHLIQHTAQGPHVRLNGTRKTERFNFKTTRVTNVP